MKLIRRAQDSTRVVLSWACTTPVKKYRLRYYLLRSGCNNWHREVKSVQIRPLALERLLVAEVRLFTLMGNGRTVFYVDPPKLMNMSLYIYANPIQHLIVLFKTCKIRKLGTAGVPICFFNVVFT